MFTYVNLQFHINNMLELQPDEPGKAIIPYIYKFPKSDLNNFQNRPFCLELCLPMVGAHEWHTYTHTQRIVSAVNFCIVSIKFHVTPILP